MTIRIIWHVTHKTWILWEILKSSHNWNSHSRLPTANLQTRSSWQFQHADLSLLEPQPNSQRHSYSRQKVHCNYDTRRHRLAGMFTDTPNCFDSFSSCSSYFALRSVASWQRNLSSSISSKNSGPKFDSSFLSWKEYLNYEYEVSSKRVSLHIRRKMSCCVTKADDNKSTESATAQGQCSGARKASD